MSRLSSITPAVLVFNEEVNIERCLASLSWAKRVVVVDSGSTDSTADIISRFANADVYVRRFTNHREQWQFALERCTGPYALALDADMAVTPALLKGLDAAVGSGASGGLVRFDYRINGASLLYSMLRPQLRLVRLSDCTVAQVGHTQRFEVRGLVQHVAGRLIHDDRKSTEHWVRSQVAYARIERDYLLQEGARTLAGRLRLAGLMPPLAGLAAFAAGGGLLNPGPSLRYAWERVAFECILSLLLREAAEGARTASTQR